MTFAQPFKDYEVLDRVGSGAMGTVFKARHKSLGRVVALKVLRPSLARDERFVNRLSREARIVAAFNHPNIVTGYDLGQEGGYHFFVMEFVDGKSLRELLSEWGSFPESQVLDTAFKITSALDHAYQKGIIHRDIKPGNILVDADNKVKLTDMGLAKGPADLTITREGATVGTPQYISPEQARDPQNVDVRSDLYSLGATLFHMCTGQPPFPAETIANVILKVVNDPAPSARDVNPEVSEALSMVIRKLMAKDPGLRYQTPAELLADLHRVQREEQPDVNLRQLEALDYVGSKPRRWGMVALGLAAVVMLVAGVLFWNGNGHGDGENLGDSDQQTARDELNKEIQQLPQKPWPERLAALKGLEAVATPAHKPLVAAARQRLEHDLRREVQDFLAGQDVQLQRWVDGGRLPEEFLTKELPDGLRQELQLRVAQLPDAVRKLWDQKTAALQLRGNDHVRHRIASQLALLQQQLDDLWTRDDYRRALEDDNFAAAKRELFDALSQIRGRGPVLSQMSPEQCEQVRAKVAEARKREMARIQKAESQIAGRLRGRVDDLTRRVRDLLAKAPTWASRKLLDGKAGLDSDFPPGHFRHDTNPWPEMNARLEALANEVETELTEHELRLLQTAVRVAYRIAFGEGRAAAAADYLEGRVFKFGQEELVQHIELLRQAAAARTELLGRIDRRQASKRFKVSRRVDRRPIEVVLKRDRGRLMMTTGRNQRVTLAEVALSALEEMAGKDFRDGLTADERAGLALWYVLGGDYAEVAKLTQKGPRSEFLNRDVKGLAEQLRKEELGPQMAATRMLEAAQQALKGGNWRQALDSVDQIHQQHPAFYASHSVEEERIKLEAQDGLGRAKKLAALKDQAPSGARVAMQGWRVSVDYSLDKVDLRPGTGWQLSENEAGGVTFVQPMPTLSTAIQNALTLKSLLPADGDGITVQITLSFPEEGAAPRLMLFRCHGVGVVLGLVRDGQVVAKGVKVSELKGPRKLRRQLQPGLHGAAEKRNTCTMYAGAKHQLKLVVVRRGRKLRGILYLDEDPNPLIPGFDVSRRHPEPELAVIAMHPLTVHSVRFEGRVEGK